MFAERYVPNWEARKVRQILSALALVVVIPALWYWWFLGPTVHSFSLRHATSSASLSATSESAPDGTSSAFPGEIAALPAPAHPVFPYSVIPGGVRSSGELQEAVRRDALVAQHYSDFRFDSAQVIRLARDKKAYVSYRVGNEIFWTRRKVTLHAGETVVSDGHNLTRGRCGNRVSDVPKFPVAPAPEQPSERTMSTPLVFAEPAELGAPAWDPPGTILAFAPVNPAAPGIALPPGGFFPGLPPPVLLMPGTSGSPSNPPPVVPPQPPATVPTPKPSSMILVLVGLVGVAIVCKRRCR